MGGAAPSSAQTSAHRPLSLFTDLGSTSNLGVACAICFVGCTAFRRFTTDVRKPSEIFIDFHMLTWALADRHRFPEVFMISDGISPISTDVCGPSLIFAGFLGVLRSFAEVHIFS